MGRAIGFGDGTGHRPHPRLPGPSVCGGPNLHNVEVFQSDARATGLPRGSFDLVHARLLLVNIPTPEQAVAEMVRLVKPEDGSSPPRRTPRRRFATHRMMPGTTSGLSFMTAYRSEGADLLRRPEVVSDAARRRASRGRRRGPRRRVPGGPPRRTILPDLVRSMREKVVQQGIVPEEELADLDRAVREHLADPGTLAMSCLYFLAWGRKPLGTRADDAD